MYDKDILVFNSGWGSGFQELVENSKTGVLKGNIVALITNNLNYQCVERAKKLGIPYELMKNFAAEDYQALQEKYKPDLFSLSGRLKLVKGLPYEKTINIHPWPLPDFGGKGMYGHYFHEAVIKAYKEGKISASEVTMHFVNDKYDAGSVFFRYPVSLRPEDTAETLAMRVNKIEHWWQSYITNLVLQGDISLLPDGTVKVPDGYDWHLPSTYG